MYPQGVRPTSSTIDAEAATADAWYSVGIGQHCHQGKKSKSQWVVQVALVAAKVLDEPARQSEACCRLLTLENRRPCNCHTNLETAISRGGPADFVLCC